jgi:hypothetical protein
MINACLDELGLSEGPRIVLNFQAACGVHPTDILYQLEQVHLLQQTENRAQTFEWLSLMRTAARVLEYREDNMPGLASHAISARHLPIVYLASMEMLTPSASPIRKALFFGHPTGRRKAILSCLRNHVDVIVDYGRARDKAIEEHALVLDINAYGPGDGNPVRCLPISASRIPVLHEGTLWGMPGVPYDRLVDTCIEMLDHGKCLKTLATAQYEALKQIDFKQKLAEVLA